MWKKVSESGFSESFLISSVHSVTFCSQVHSNLTPDWTIYYLVVQLLSHVQLFATPWTAACQASLSFTISLNLPKLMSIELMMLSNNLILCHPLLLLLSIFSSISVFSNELLLHIKGLNVWSFSFSNSPSNEYPGLTSFRIDWFDLLVVQGTLKSLL